MENRTNRSLKIASRKIMLLAMAFCLPIPAQAMHALVSRVTDTGMRAARMGTQGVGRAFEKNARPAMQASQRAFSAFGPAKQQARSKAGANFGKVALAASGLAGTFGVNQALTQEEMRNRRRISANSYRITLQYSSEEEKVCDLRNQEQVKKWWLEYRVHEDQTVIKLIEQFTNKEWVKNWKTELQEEQQRLKRETDLQLKQWHEEGVRRSDERLRLFIEQEEKRRQEERDLEIQKTEREQAERAREFAEREREQREKESASMIAGIVKRMADRSLEAQKERDSKDKTWLGINKNFAAVMSIGIGAIGVLAAVINLENYLNLNPMAIILLQREHQKTVPSKKGRHRN